MRDDWKYILIREGDGVNDRFASAPKIYLSAENRDLATKLAERTEDVIYDGECKLRVEEI